MSKIKIFVDCHVFDGSFQGTTTYIKGLYNELLKDKDKIFYFAANDTAHISALFGVRDNVHYLKYTSKNKFFRLLFDIPGLIRKHNIDYAHFQYVMPPVRACRYIVTIHDVLFLDYPALFPALYKIKNKFLFGLSAKRAHYLLTVSQYSKSRIMHHFKRYDVVVTPNAVDPAFFEVYDKVENRQLAEEKFGAVNYWLYVSRWEPRKNHHTLLKVFAMGGYYKQSHLVLAGDDAIDNPEYNKLYASLDKEIQDRIIRLKKVSFTDLLLLIRGATLVAYPSIAEGFGIPPLESAAAGIPTICSDSSAMGDFVFFKDTLFSPLSADEMKRAIDAAFLADRQDELRQIIGARYSWEKSAAVLRAILNK